MEKYKSRRNWTVQFFHFYFRRRSEDGIQKTKNPGPRLLVVPNCVPKISNSQKTARRNQLFESGCDHFAVHCERHFLCNILAVRCRIPAVLWGHCWFRFLTWACFSVLWLRPALFLNCLCPWSVVILWCRESIFENSRAVCSTVCP